MTVGEVPSRPTSVHPQTRARLQHVIVNNVLATADTWQISACHCEPVHGGPAEGHPLRGEEPQGSVAPPLAFGRWGAWRTLGRRGVAIRVPAEKPGKVVVLRATS